MAQERVLCFLFNVVAGRAPTIRSWQRRKDILTKGSVIQLITEVFVEPPLALPGSAKYLDVNDT